MGTGKKKSEICPRSEKSQCGLSGMDDP